MIRTHRRFVEMATDLLRKEEEFRKLNEKLEEKSKYLLHEVDIIKVSSIIKKGNVMLYATYLSII